MNVQERFLKYILLIQPQTLLLKPLQVPEASWILLLF